MSFVQVWCAVMHVGAFACARPGPGLALVFWPILPAGGGPPRLRREGWPLGLGGSVW